MGGWGERHLNFFLPFFDQISDPCEKNNVFSLILRDDRLVVALMSCGRLFRNFGAGNIKVRSPRVFDDFIGRKQSKVPSRALRRL